MRFITEFIVCQLILYNGFIYMAVSTQVIKNSFTSLVASEVISLMTVFMIDKYNIFKVKNRWV